MEDTLLEIEKVLFELLPRDNNGLWGFISHDGNEIIPFAYDYADHFSDDLALVGKHGKFGFIDTVGTLIIPLIFEDAKYFHKSLCSVKVNGKWGVINLSGSFIINAQYDYIGFFDDSFGALVAEVVKDGKKGLINTQNEIILHLA